MSNLSEKQITANKGNAQLGGVKTDEGKKIVRFNARKHGILAGLVADYEEQFHKQYVEQLFEDFKPENTIEELLVERIAIHYLKLFRIMKAEKQYINFCIRGRTFDFDDAFVAAEHKPQISVTDFESFVNLFQRYETNTENRLYRAIQELKSLRSQRELGLFGKNE